MLAERGSCCYLQFCIVIVSPQERRWRKQIHSAPKPNELSFPDRYEGQPLHGRKGFEDS
jgi:hypothetical protein